MALINASDLSHDFSMKLSLFMCSHGSCLLRLAPTMFYLMGNAVQIDISPVPSSHPLMRKSSLVNHVKFLGITHTFATKHFEPHQLTQLKKCSDTQAKFWTGLKHGTDQETDRKTNRLNLTFVALQVVGRAFTVMV